MLQDEVLTLKSSHQALSVVADTVPALQKALNDKEQNEVALLKSFKSLESENNELSQVLKAETEKFQAVQRQTSRRVELAKKTTMAAFIQELFKNILLFQTNSKDVTDQFVNACSEEGVKDVSEMVGWIQKLVNFIQTENSKDVATLQEQVKSEISVSVQLVKNYENITEENRKLSKKLAFASSSISNSSKEKDSWASQIEKFNIELYRRENRGFCNSISSARLVAAFNDLKVELDTKVHACAVLTTSLSKAQESLSAANVSVISSQKECKILYFKQCAF